MIFADLRSCTGDRGSVLSASSDYSQPQQEPTYTYAECTGALNAVPFAGAEEASAMPKTLSAETSSTLITPVLELGDDVSRGMAPKGVMRHERYHIGLGGLLHDDRSKAPLRKGVKSRSQGFGRDPSTSADPQMLDAQSVLDEHHTGTKEGSVSPVSEALPRASGSIALTMRGLGAGDTIGAFGRGVAPLRDASPGASAMAGMAPRAPMRNDSGYDGLGRPADDGIVSCPFHDAGGFCIEQNGPTMVAGRQPADDDSKADGSRDAEKTDMLSVAATSSATDRPAMHPGWGSGFLLGSTLLLSTYKGIWAICLRRSWSSGVKPSLRDARSQTS